MNSRRPNKMNLTLYSAGTSGKPSYEKTLQLQNNFKCFFFFDVVCHFLLSYGTF